MTCGTSGLGARPPSEEELAEEDRQIRAGFARLEREYAQIMACLDANREAADRLCGRRIRWRQARFVLERLGLRGQTLEGESDG